MSNIHGIGVDQVNLNRIRKILDKSKSKFEARCFTNHEIEYANKFNDPANGNASQLAETNKVGTIHVSLSHEKETAIAFVISEVA